MPIDAAARFRLKCRTAKNSVPGKSRTKKRIQYGFIARCGLNGANTISVSQTGRF